MLALATTIGFTSCSQDKAEKSLIGLTDAVVFGRIAGREAALLERASEKIMSYFFLGIGCPANKANKISSTIGQA